MPKLRKSIIGKVDTLIREDPERTDVEIGKEVGVDRKTVAKRRKLLGVTVTSQKTERKYSVPYDEVFNPDSEFEGGHFTLADDIADIYYKIQGLDELLERVNVIERIIFEDEPCPECGGRLGITIHCQNCDLEMIRWRKGRHKK